ncbi:MAG TPA: glutamate--tRNA ligase family protein, partial [Chitinophagaceae bacterium]|nr:glutamate--tRNA ligase family protein [Chitinophagaceae bacterium]
SAKYGFPVFAMGWTDPKTNELTEGFREKGFLAEAFINFLALLGWNDGTEQEIFTKEELIEKFSIERVHSGGAKFDYEKAKWFNHEWIKQSGVSSLKSVVAMLLDEKGISDIDDAMLEKVIGLIKDRCTLLTDFYDQSYFFFKAPDKWDMDAVKPKWNEEKKNFFTVLISKYANMQMWKADPLENIFRETAAELNIKAGELQLPYRIMLVGGKFGPPVFNIAEILGKEETISRIKKALPVF